jgi:hypothetical protein
VVSLTWWRDIPLHRFIPALTIRSRAGSLTRLTPNDEQVEILEALESGDDTLILKPRQIGSTTIISAFLFWRWYTSADPTTVAILSHKQRSSVHILDIWRRCYSALPPELRRPLSVTNTTRMQLADTGAEVIAAGAGDQGGIRSFSAHVIHLSEFAFSPNAPELLAASVGALAPGGQLIAESTANHWGDQLHTEIQKTERGEGRWRLLFFPWFAHQHYREDVPDDVDWTPEEQELSALHELSDAQLWWRRGQVGRIGLDKFRREYPATITDAYSQRAGAWLSDTDLRYLQVVQAAPTGFTYFGEYHPDHRYAIGVDVGSGVGRDYTVAVCLDKMSYQPVAVWRSNRASLREASSAVMELAGRFDAMVLVESNNHGHAMLLSLRRDGWTRFWSDSNGKDWTTTAKSKALMWAGLKNALQDGSLYQLDQVTAQELRQLIVDEQGRVVVPATLTGHCDSATALALAFQCLQLVRLPRESFLPDWVKARRVDRTHRQGALHSLRRY